MDLIDDLMRSGTVVVVGAGFVLQLGSEPDLAGLGIEYESRLNWFRVD